MTEQELKEQLKRYEWALAEVEALVLSHEGHISKLEDWQAKALPYLRTYHAFYWLTSNKDLSVLIEQAHKEVGE